MPPLVAATSKIGYVRLHGRNRETYFARNVSAADRFDYLFSSSLFFSVIDPTTLTMRYVNAGHNPPLLLRDGVPLSLLWWGLFLYAVPALSGFLWISVLGPAFITVLLLFISGIPLLEKIADAEPRAVQQDV